MDNVEELVSTGIDYDEAKSMVENPDSYNGWTNYESWAVFTWLGNDPGSYNEARSIVLGNTDPEQRLHDWVQDYWLFPEPIQPINASLRSDLLLHSLRRVNWREVVNALRE